MAYNLAWLKIKFDNGEKLRYIFFWGHSNKGQEEIGKFVFSQWFPSPFTVDTAEYKTAEHWMMVHKALLFSDPETAEKILKADKPGEVKDLGRKIKNFDQDRWNESKFEIVKQGSIHKFSQDKKLKKYLLNTGDRIIVEASPTDAIWGIGLTHDVKNIEDPNTWRGENLLGFALMEARDFLKTSN